MAELDGVADIEHPDVSLSHESGWTLSAFPSGLVVWENVEGDTEPRHLREVSRAEVRRLWLALSEGDVASVEAHGWDQGEGAVAQPPLLADLLPLAEVWGVSDDVEREAAVDRADLDELEGLVRAVDDAGDVGLYEWLTGEESYAAT